MSFEKVGLICISDGRLLLARSRNNDTFYIPGGKIERGESREEALRREVFEELSVKLEDGSIQKYGCFSAQAHGKPAGVYVDLICYFASFHGEIKPGSEIEELRWVFFGENIACSEVTKMIMQKLYQDHHLKNCFAYDYVFFDADNTLFEFNDFLVLKSMFEKFNIDFTNDDFESYQNINKPLWARYQNGEISAKDIQLKRFEHWAKKLEVSPEELNQSFLATMAETSLPFDGAEILLERLKSFHISLVLVSNGFTELHSARLRKTKFDRFFDHVVISDAVGAAKPSQRIFDHAISLLNEADRSRVLMVGDTFESDIDGAHQSRIHSCWFNRHGLPVPDGKHSPNHTITSLSQLGEIIFLKKPESPRSSGMWRHIDTPVEQKSNQPSRRAF